MLVFQISSNRPMVLEAGEMELLPTAGVIHCYAITIKLSKLPLSQVPHVADN